MPHQTSATIEMARDCGKREALASSRKVWTGAAAANSTLSLELIYEWRDVPITQEGGDD
jgi:hypothetical protein